MFRFRQGGLMKPVFRSVLCILCTVTLLFTGCENPFARREEESSSLVEYAAGTVYTEIPLPMPEDIQEDPVFHDKTIDVWFAADTGMQGVYTSAEGEKMAVLYDWSGNLIHTATLPETELQSIRTFRPLSDGTLLLFVNERESADALSPATPSLSQRKTVRFCIVMPLTIPSLEQCIWPYRKNRSPW